MDFSHQQRAALKSIDRWIEGGKNQVFKMFGYAGTGKTTLAKHMAENVRNGVLYAAFTGKASYVLRSKGCTNASTIHSLIYLPKEKSSERLKLMVEELEKLTEGHPYIPELSNKIADEKINLSRPSFSLNLESKLRDVGLLIIDEVSMVDENMARDLLSFGTKILVLGDPAQLPPVFGTGYFIQDQPDVMLTDIHRQARDNPIIHLADQIRNQRMPPPGQYGDSLVTDKIDAAMVQDADQLLVGKNVTRKSSNKRYRQLLNMKGELPLAGDKIVCLRNENEAGLINGAIWHVSEVESSDEDAVYMTVVSEDDQVLDVVAHTGHFLDKEIPLWERKERSEFDYAYALTVHKAQGSQWDRVCLLDESHIFRKDRWKWLYTGITRAAETVTMVNRS